MTQFFSDFYTYGPSDFELNAFIQPTADHGAISHSLVDILDSYVHKSILFYGVVGRLGNMTSTSRCVGQ